MLTRGLIKALEYAESPRAIHAATWALEALTGHRTVDLVQYKDLYGNGTAEWYNREGFYRLGSAHGAGTRSYSGKTVTVDAALESAAFYAGVKIISEDMGSLPFFAFEKDKAGESVEKAYSNSLYRVLHDQPNPEMASGEFRESITARCVLGLDGFARIVRSGITNNVIALWPLIKQAVTLDHDGNNQLVYIVKDGSEQEKTYSADQIFHIKGFTLDGSRGDAILQRARHAIGLTLAGDEYAGRFFAQDASPGVILTRPVGSAPLNAESTQKVKDAWKQWHQGLSRSHEPAVLEAGAVASRLDPDHQKLQMLESRRYQVVEVARILRMPLHKLADLERATNNNIEHQGLEYTTQCLGPWRRRWEDAVHRCLLLPKEQYWPNGRPRMFAEFNVEALVRGDFATQTAGFSTMLQNGVYSINQVLKYLNLNPIPGGDVHRVQVNMQDVTATANDLLKAA